MTGSWYPAVPAAPADPLGIYLHIPFCHHICPYCDFNTYRGQENLIPAYVQALVTAIRAEGQRLGHPEAATIFLGGGTPSLLTPAQIGAVVGACREAFVVADDAEITLESNPNNLDLAYCAGLLERGINRLSIGVQTTHHRGLRVLGRQHTARDAETALASARQAGFINLSLDLIFGWPEQTESDWLVDLETVLGWGPDHLSLYSLIVEPGTPMADAVGRGILRVPDDDLTADWYEAAITRLRDAGWVHYEIANWAKSIEVVARHNVLYWQNGFYTGLGAGAHGYTNGVRSMEHQLPRTWIRAVEEGQRPVATEEVIDNETAMGETMMLGLRLLTAGVSEPDFAARHGRQLREVFGETVADFTERGLLESVAGRIRLTHRGMLFANDVCAAFLPVPVR